MGWKRPEKIQTVFHWSAVLDFSYTKEATDLRQATAVSGVGVPDEPCVVVDGAGSTTRDDPCRSKSTEGEVVGDKGIVFLRILKDAMVWFSGEAIPGGEMLRRCSGTAVGSLRA